MKTYDASSIRVLKGLEAVRRRPAMYVGSTGPGGVRHLVLEVFQNAIDEALAGHARSVALVVHDDGSYEVEDDGRGIPVDPHPDTGRPACEVVLTTLHAGGKFGEGAYASPGGQHGVGLACVSALSEWLVLEVWRDGWRWRQTFARGHVTSALEKVEPTARRGTRVRFRPDHEIFGAHAAADERSLVDHLRAQSFLNPGLGVAYENRATARREQFASDAGLAGFVAWLNRDRQPVHASPILVRGRFDGVDVDVAMQWTHAYAEDAWAYVNNVHTVQGGTHVEGLRAALTRVLNRVAAERGLTDGNGEHIAGWDMREGLASVVAVRLPEPEFEGQTKSTLSSRGVTAAVDHVVGEGLALWLSGHAEEAAAIVGRAIEAARARAAARRASERARYLKQDLRPDREVYRQQFGIRSRNWHESARWITDEGLLGAHAAACPERPGALVLDVCCGTGVVAAALRGRVGRIVGLDITPEMAAIARTRLDEVVLGDVYEIPFPDAMFDLVVTREVLHILPVPERPVSEIFRVLRPGGRFITGQWVPYGPADAAWMFRIVKKKQPLFWNNLLEEDVTALLSRAGFAPIEVSEYLQWEDIDTWIDSWETPNLQRHQIRDLYYRAPAEVRAVHPFRVHPSGAIEDCWRWCVFSAGKPGKPREA